LRDTDVSLVWLSFWACKIVAHFLPRIFEFLVGVVSPGIKKYVQLLAALEKPLSFVFWMVVNQVTYQVLIVQPTKKETNWMSTVGSVLLALLVCTCIILAERVLIQLISISYHRKQFDQKIKDSKRNIYLLGVMYDASRALFPEYCNEFAEEDYIIQDNMPFIIGSRKGTMGHNRAGSKSPMRLLQNVGRGGDKITGVFGAVAQEITGKKVFDPNSAHSIVLEAIEHNRSAEALSRRIWLSFVEEGKNELYMEDLVEVMGAGRQQEAEECFGALDKDENGDISLEEMIMTVAEFGRERKSIASSMHDVDQAINALDALLFSIVFIVCIFVIVCFLSPSFKTTLATSATALLSLSFVFAATCQEVLGSCIFLFVKHPYDIGDRVDIAADQFTVEHISLLYTVFKRVNNGKIVQTPNIVLNNLWVENITRSTAMREQVSIFCDFGTSFEDISALKQEMASFVSEPANTRDFHTDIEVEVVSIAEMNKLELRVEIRHKSNWSNESLRASRRSKFMCALVMALRKVPIAGPGGSDAALGSADKPSWSVAVSPEQAQAVRQRYLDDKDAARLYPTNQKDDDEDKGKSTGFENLGTGTESAAINQINIRKPGVDAVRDDTWGARDDGNTIGRPSMDGRPSMSSNRPDLDEVRGLLHKASSGGRRKGGATLAPTPSGYSTETRQAMPPLPLAVNPSPQHTNFGNPYAPPPLSVPRTPASPNSVSTGNIEEYQYQTMVPPPPRNDARGPSIQLQQQPGALRQTPSNATNPYRTQSPTSPRADQYQYRP
jgi:small-conductance mechanosensitive channel